MFLEAEVSGRYGGGGDILFRPDGGCLLMDKSETCLDMAGVLQRF
jgi:hypothetical protein